MTAETDDSSKKEITKLNYSKFEFILSISKNDWNFITIPLITFNVICSGGEFEGEQLMRRK